MGLPSSRDRTYAPGSQVESADLNDIQDQIIALSAVTDWLAAIGGGAPGHSGDTAWSSSSSGGYIEGASAGLDWVMPLPVRVGTTITLTAYVWTTASGGFVNLVSVDPTNGTVTVVESVAVGSTGFQSIAFAAHAVTSGLVYYVQFNMTTGGGTKRIFGIQKAWHR